MFQPVISFSNDIIFLQWGAKQVFGRVIIRAGLPIDSTVVSTAGYRALCPLFWWQEKVIKKKKEKSSKRWLMVSEMRDEWWVSDRMLYTNTGTQKKQAREGEWPVAGVCQCCWFVFVRCFVVLEFLLFFIHNFLLFLCLWCFCPEQQMNGWYRTLWVHVEIRYFNIPLLQYRWYQVPVVPVLEYRYARVPTPHGTQCTIIAVIEWVAYCNNTIFKDSSSPQSPQQSVPCIDRVGMWRLRVRLVVARPWKGIIMQ